MKARMSGALVVLADQDRYRAFGRDVLSDLVVTYAIKASFSDGHERL